MPLHGIQPIVNQSASVVWSDETSPSPELVTLFDMLPDLFEMATRKKSEIRDKLDKISGYDPQPSQELRKLYWSGRLLQELGDHKQAFTFFSDARLVAEDHHDVLSALELTYCMATTQFDMLLSAEALDLYREMLAMWEKLEPNLRRLDTEIQIRALICRQEWTIGKFDIARGAFARALTKALDARSGQQTPELKKEIANALWDLGLALRSDSDLKDGDLNILQRAKQRMKTARDIYLRLGVPHSHLARLDIQLSDIYFDIAELHQQRNKGESARAMRNRGEPLAREARDFLVGSEDSAAVSLAEIVSLRPDIMWPQRATRDEIEDRLASIERAAKNDTFVLAKAATLRADWLMTLGEWGKARTALTFAIEGFGENGKGMATRAERLMRHLPPTHAPEEGYGGANPEQGGRN